MALPPTLQQRNANWQSRMLPNGYKPEDILALCLFKYGFSEEGLEKRYGCDYFSTGNPANGANPFGFGACTLYQEEGVVLFSAQKLELFSEVGEAYWDSNHISHFLGLKQPLGLLNLASSFSFHRFHLLCIPLVLCFVLV